MPQRNLVILVLVAAVALGALTVFFIGKSDPDKPIGSPALKVASGTAPAFHVFGSQDEKEAAIAGGLRKLTSGKAVELGALKDDMALLSTEPSMQQRILEAFHQRSHLTTYEASGFLDIFAKVKNPRFVEPTSKLLMHEDWAVQRSAIPAAATQAHESLTPALLTVYRKMVSEFKNEGEQTRAEVIAAAQACGGPTLGALLDQAMSDPSALVVEVAVSAAQARNLKALAPRIRELLKHDVGAISLRSAWALGSFGDPEGKTRVLDFLDLSRPPEFLAALDAVCALGIADARPKLKALLQTAPLDYRLPLIVALCVLKDPETTKELEAQRDSEDRSKLEESLAGLGATADPKYLPFIRRCARTGQRPELLAILRGMAAHESPPDVESLGIILAAPGMSHPDFAESVIVRAGDALVPKIVALLDTTENESRAAYAVSCLSLIGTELARESLITAHKRWPGVVEQGLRLLDLNRRKRGL